ncbi:MAG: DUF222 domain-containing protein [Nocardioides sp.]
MSTWRPALEGPPLLRCLTSIGRALDDVAELDATYLSTDEKARALRSVDRELSRLEGLRMQLLAASADVASDDGARSAGVWLARESRAGTTHGVRSQRQAEAMKRWPLVRRALREALLNPAQACVIAAALDDLPHDLDPELAAKAGAHLVGEAGHFGPRELRVLGRRVLEVVAPDVADRHEERLLAAEEQRGRDETRVVFRPRGGGVTDVLARLPEQMADRLRAYLDSFTAPRRRHLERPLGDVDLLPLPRRRGAAFCSLLEQLPSSGLPSHGGTATSVVVTIDVESLRQGLGSADLSTGGRISATEARRLACSALLLPAVLGGRGEVLDLGRSRRLFSPAQRKAMAIRDRRCRAQGCDIPAAWCEAHHAGRPWATGGRTDLSEGLLLCSFHHHRAHDRRWDASRLANGDVRYARRT